MPWLEFTLQCSEAPEQELPRVVSEKVAANCQQALTLGVMLLDLRALPVDRH